MSTAERPALILRIALVMLFSGIVALAILTLGQTTSGEWDADPSMEEVPAEESEDGLQFQTPFLMNTSHLLLSEISDCGTGEPLEAELVSAAFSFNPEAIPPYEASDIESVSIGAYGYDSREISSFHSIEIPLGFLTITLLVPELSEICLQAHSSAEADQPDPSPPPSTPTTTPGGQPPYDWGDAPDASYRTRAMAGGPHHGLFPDLFGPCDGWTGPCLGWTIDDEADGQPSSTATGDGADEDGIFEDIHYMDRFGTNPLPAGLAPTLVVYTAAPGLLDAWIDFDANRYWDGPGERIFVHYPLVRGQNILEYAMPLLFQQSLDTAATYARFRISTYGCDRPVGGADDGEVEDYLIPIPDFGDAPDANSPGFFYRTLLSSDGARHRPVDPITGAFSPRLGQQADADLDGHPSIGATGDDRDKDDEDGVFEGHYGMTPYVGEPFGTNPLIRGQPFKIMLKAAAEPGYGTGPAFLDAWIDFNADGDWDDEGEQVFDSERVVPQSPGFSPGDFQIQVPSTAALGWTYARFRISSSGGLGHYGLAEDGEVEDYAVWIVSGIECGDAPDDPANPDDYPTLMASDGARHTGGPYLGNQVDLEADGRPSSCADADDIAGMQYGIDDEDGAFEDATLGIPFGVSPLVIGQRETIHIIASGSSYLDAWIDFNADGDWADDGEKVAESVVLVRGENSIEVLVPADAVFGATYARFRCSERGGLSYLGDGGAGEVEDYRIVLTHVSGS